MIYPALLGPFKFMPKSFQWDPKNVKQRSPQKKFGMGYLKMHGFHGNLLYDSRDWWVGLQIQSYLRFYLS